MRIFLAALVFSLGVGPAIAQETGFAVRQTEVKKEPFSDAETVGTLAEKSQFTIKAVKAYMRAIAAGADEDTPETKGIGAQAYANEDYREGVRAFMEKRKPKFTYR